METAVVILPDDRVDWVGVMARVTHEFDGSPTSAGFNFQRRGGSGLVVVDMLRPGLAVDAELRSWPPDERQQIEHVVGGTPAMALLGYRRVEDVDEIIRALVSVRPDRTMVDTNLGVLVSGSEYIGMSDLGQAWPTQRRARD